MKKQTSILLLCLFLAVYSLGQTTGEKKGWKATDRQSFISSCIANAKEHLRADSARFYCYCMLEFTELKYPNPEDAGKLTDADIQQPDWQKAISECGGGYWTTRDREDFLTDCVKSAKAGGLPETRATGYCECMLYKIEKAFPDIKTAMTELTEELMKSPKWMGIIKGCLEF